MGKFLIAGAVLVAAFFAYKKFYSRSTSQVTQDVKEKVQDANSRFQKTADKLKKDVKDIQKNHSEEQK